jgi:hypothetical protein
LSPDLVQIATGKSSGHADIEALQQEGLAAVGKRTASRWAWPRPRDGSSPLSIGPIGDAIPSLMPQGEDGPATQTAVSIVPAIKPIEPLGKR